jgi:hypothetical protein
MGDGQGMQYALVNDTNWKTLRKQCTCETNEEGGERVIFKFILEK